jgi:alpha-tubulin suppressor-like RCC1 family protein
MQLRQENVISCGISHTAAIGHDGRVVCWGSYKVHGKGYIPCDDYPRELDNVAAVACDFNFTMALTQDGKLTCWGRRDTDFYGLFNVPAGLENVISISCRNGHAAAVTQDGRVVCWGNNRNGQSSVPEDLEFVTGASCTDAHTVVVTADGKIRSWGGKGTVDEVYDTPPELPNVVAVSCGAAAISALTQD